MTGINAVMSKIKTKIKMNRFWGLIIILFFFVTNPVSAQTADFDSTVSKGIKEIYSIKFPDAEMTFRKLIADYPDHPAGRFFLAMIDWWKILLDLDNESFDDIFYQKLEDVIYQCDEILNKEPENVDALFFKGGAIGFRGRLRATRESWIKAADDGREALPIVERAHNIDPSNVDVQLGFGIYNYYASVIPQEYPIIKPLMLFFPSGDKQKGIEQLTNTAYNGKYAKYEARYFLMTLYYNYENNPAKATEFAELLTNDFPDNPSFERWYGRIAIKKGDTKKASEIFRSILAKSEKKLTGYNTNRVKREAVYYIAVNYRSTFQPDSALIYFEECEKLSRIIDTEEESGFLINSVLYIGMLHEQMGNKDKAIQRYEQLLDMREYGSSHSVAEDNLERLRKN
jgi:tetratricopeptide (TPR) repeat protein